MADSIGRIKISQELGPNSYHMCLDCSFTAPPFQASNSRTLYPRGYSKPQEQYKWVTSHAIACMQSIWLTS